MLILVFGMIVTAYGLTVYGGSEKSGPLTIDELELGTYWIRAHSSGFRAPNEFYPEREYPLGYEVHQFILTTHGLLGPAVENIFVEIPEDRLLDFPSYYDGSKQRTKFSDRTLWNGSRDWYPIVFILREVGISDEEIGKMKNLFNIAMTIQIEEVDGKRVARIGYANIFIKEGDCLIDNGKVVLCEGK